MFSTSIIDYIAGPKNDNTWTSFYEQWNASPPHWNELAFTMDQWNRIKKRSDLIDHIENYPHHGFLLCTNHHKPIIIHNMIIVDDTIYAFSGNRITTPPIEWITDNKIHTLLSVTTAAEDPVTTSGIITQDSQTADPDDADTTGMDAIAPSTIATSKRIRRRIPKRKDLPLSSATNEKYIDSMFILHPCLLARFLRLPKPYTLHDITRSIDDLEQAIINSSDIGDQEFDQIHAANQHILGFFQLCEAQQLHRSSIVPIDEERADMLMSQLSINIRPADRTNQPLAREINFAPVSTAARTTQYNTENLNPVVEPSPPTAHAETTTDSNTLDVHHQTEPVPNDADVVLLDQLDPSIPTETSPHSTDQHATGTATNTNPATSLPPMLAPPPSFPSIPVNRPTDLHALASQIQSLTDLAQVLFNNQAAQQQQSIHQSHLMDTVLARNSSAPASNKSLFDSLPPTVQLAIIRGSSIDHMEPEPTQPHQACMDLISTAHKAKAPSYLHSLLRDAGVRGHYQLGQLTRLLHNGPIWSSPDKPEGLTVFAIASTSDESDTNRDREVLLSLKACHDNHLDTDDATFLAKKGYFYPANVNEFETMLTTYTTLCSIYFGPTSLITRGLQSWVNHLTDNHPSYESQSKGGNIFGTRVLYCIDLNIQQHLHLIKHRHVPLSNIPSTHVQAIFAQLQAQVIGRQLTVNLPPDLVNEIARIKRGSKAADDNPRPTRIPRSDDYHYSTPPNSTNRSSAAKAYPPADPAELVTNPRINPKWRIPSKFNFFETFHKNKEIKPPMHNNTPFCVQFHTCGNCKRGRTCKFLHTDPRDVQMEQVFDAYCEKAYSLQS